MGVHPSAGFFRNKETSPARTYDQPEEAAMGVWLRLVSCLVLIDLPNEVPFLRDKPLGDLEIERWVDRSRMWAERLTDLERAEEGFLFADYYVQLGQCRTAFIIISGIKEPTARGDAIVSFCGSLASHGEVDPAIRLAGILPDGAEDSGNGEQVLSTGDSLRTRALRAIALFRMIRGDLQGALAATRQIGDEHARARVLLLVAKSAAKAGHYDAAKETLRSARELWTGDPTECAAAEKMIDDYCREARIDVQPPRAGLLNTLRAVVDAFAEEPAQGGECEGPPNHSESRKPVLSFETAWNRLAAGDVGGARAVAEKLLRFVDSRPERLAFAKAVDYCLLADLFLELGEKEKAQELLAKTYPVLMQGSELDQGLASFTILPLVVSVFARSGGVQQALHLIEKADKQESSFALTGQAWLAFGASCALVGRIDVVEELVKEDRPARQKAILSLGVAVGLMEGKRQ